MNESKHTPGPWKAQKFKDTKSWTIYGAPPYSLASVKYEDDARLIAAAPDLLDMLHEIAEFLDQRADADCDQDGFVPNAEMRLLSEVGAAIAKAEGRA